jgi:hypothetical protein
MRIDLCVPLVIRTPHLHVCTQCSHSPSCLQIHMTPGWPLATAHRRTFTLTIVFTNRTTPGWPLATAHRRTFTLTIVFANTHDPRLAIGHSALTCCRLTTTIPHAPIFTTRQPAFTKTLWLRFLQHIIILPTLAGVVPSPFTMAACPVCAKPFISFCQRWQVWCLAYLQKMLCLHTLFHSETFYRSLNTQFCAIVFYYTGSTPMNAHER